MLDVVQDYINEARAVLQDEVQPYRYSDADLISAMGMGIYEMRRVRPDLFVGSFSSLQSLDRTSPASTTVNIDPQYRKTLLYYVLGHVNLREDEQAEESRAAGFMGKFVQQLLSIAS